MENGVGERQGLLRVNGVYIENNKDLFLGMGFAHMHAQDPASTLFPLIRSIQVQ